MEESKDNIKESVVVEKKKAEEVNVEEKKKKRVDFKSKETQNIILAVTITMAIFVLAGAITWFSYQKKNYIGEARAKNITEKFINENLLGGQGELEIKEIIKKEGLYELKLLVNKVEYISYLTSNGEVFFPQGMNIKETEELTKKQKEEQERIMNVEIPKAEKPFVEVFVMSYCPYGTQLQKGILPVMELLKDKAKIEFKFVDYAMHGDKEIDENLNQYCIQQKEPAKYLGYLKCFLKEGDSKSCLISEKINNSLLTSCKNELDAKFEIKKKAADKATWSGGQFPPFDLQKEDNEKYNVQGSPTVIINGTEIPSIQRDANSLLKKICSAFDVAPIECQTELSAQVPSSGFGENTAATGATSSEVDCAE